MQHTLLADTDSTAGAGDGGGGGPGWSRRAREAVPCSPGGGSVGTDTGRMGYGGR
ncbi:hypothetical protein GCM10018777_67180 [Streptomyces albogriseolus]|nr:hypothetical protein GCM10010332_07200 [Streptomyces albogriseolus]GHG40335.1 hypothetical protein GCM10018777_67180 [Streptomyces viridodiastaticus]